MISVSKAPIENLINRLPELMKQFKQDILKAGIEWPEGY